ncbi:MAG TPA: V-type ATP synthase subunit B [Gammaproteobacteria bacterium]|nr:V-type ATP synthase subunit B [Gammaproteobacteria bacterium]
MKGDLSIRDCAQRLEGPLLFLDRPVSVGLNEAVEVIGADDRVRMGRIAALDEQHIVVEVLDPTSELALPGMRVRLLGAPLSFGVGPGLLGRIFDGVGRPLDSGPAVAIAREQPIDGLPANPVERDLPEDFIETGVSAIDLLNSLVRGQKLPIFSAGGLPHSRLAIDIAGHARLLQERDDRFAIVFAGIGVSHATAERFRRALADSGALERSALFLNLASDSSIQRLLTPRFALTAAEYLAFTEGLHVLVILTDMTNYCEALREVSSSHGEIPSRKGYPGHLYSDLATLFERAGRIRGRPGTLTQLPVLTMPGDDISHPIPDLTGYITEGQIVLDRDLDRRDIYPPVTVLPSLSRLMDLGTGKGYTDADHPALASQLYAAYARAREVRLLASVVGEEGLPAADRRYLAFGDAFEQRLLHQERPRSLVESMEIGWSLLRELPVGDLVRLSDTQIEAHIGTGDGEDVPGD